VTGEDGSGDEGSIDGGPRIYLKTYLSIIPRIIGGLSLLLWEMK
jgi:hypothetical protein